MLIKEHWGIENAPFWHYLILIRSIPRNNCKIFVTENPWLKFEPNLLTWLPNGKIEKTTVYLLFSLFIQFSAKEIGLVFSHAKLMISLLQWLEKKVGCPYSLVSYSHFSTDRAIWRQIRNVFNMHVHALSDAILKLCAEGMRNANVKTFLSEKVTRNVTWNLHNVDNCGKIFVIHSKKVKRK